MKKLILVAYCLGTFLITGNTLNAQAGIGGAIGSKSSDDNKDSPATPANVLKWTKEVLPKMERLVPKLEKIKADNKGTKAEMDGIKCLIAVTQLKEINAKGTRLKVAEAKRYYDLIAATVNSFYIECQSQNGNVCCVTCNPHGFLGIWCYANCFVSRHPARD